MPILRSPTCLLLGVLFLVGAGMASGLGESDPSSAWLDGQEYPCWHQAANELGAVLDRRCAALLQRLEAKHAVIQQLLNGDLTLFEAAAWFRFFSEKLPDWPDEVRREYPGASEGERWCREVITWVNMQLLTQSSSSVSVEVGQQLEEELNEHLARYGTVELPDWAKSTEPGP